MITVALDASTYVGSVAVFEDRRLLAHASAAMRGRESELLMPAVAEAMRIAAVEPDALSCIVCGAGPGSFTSLRIAASIAKGLAVGRGIPLYAVSSLALVVAGNVAVTGAGERYLARLDALRGESYVAPFEHGDGRVRPVGPVTLVPHGELADVAAGMPIVGPNEPESWNPHVKGLPLLWDTVFAQPVDATVWEPSYGRLAEAQVKWEATHGRALHS